MRSRDLLSANASCASAVPLILSVALLLAMPLAHGNISVEWTPCECNSPTYTLTAYTSGYGTVSKSPDKAAYDKGEAVIVTFTPNADRVFTYWYGSPPSHLAHLSEETAAVVFMTANTILIPVTEAKTKTLYVNWDTARGTVELPPGGQGGSGSFTAPVNYGETITLTATPNSGYYTVWAGQYTNDVSGERYGNSVNVKMLNTKKLSADFRPNAGYPGTMNTLTLNMSGGEADVFSAGALSASFNSGLYPYTSATGPSRFSFLFLPRKGYAWKYLTWMADGQARYTTSTGITFYPGATFTGQLVEKIRLNIETEGQGVISSPQFQYWWNPQPYYSVALTNPPATSITPNVNANAVTMTPSACPGWSFDHWEYKNAQGEWISTPGTNLTIYMNWWAGTGIRVPNGETLFNVKAVFGKHAVTDFHSTLQEQTVGTCFSTAYDFGQLNCTYVWDSSTGYCTDLTGKVVEVLSYDASVTLNEMLDCLEAHRADILQPGSGVLTPCTSQTVNIDPLWAAAMGDGQGNPFVPFRFYYWGKSDASAGSLADTNGLHGPCWLSCASAGYIVTQYFFHVPNCGEIKKVGGPFDINRNSPGDHANLCIVKHSSGLCSGCQAQWQSCTCD